MMTNWFEKNIARWVRYMDYEWVTSADGVTYLKPAKGASVRIYNPFEDTNKLVLDTIDTAIQCYNYRDNDPILKELIRQYVCKYGLLGIMTALPATVSFTEYEKVFLPKNILIKDTILDTEAYLDMFFPFGRPGKKTDDEYDMRWLEGLFDDHPEEIQMVIMPEYCERLDWLKKIFRDWAFLFRTVILAKEPITVIDMLSIIELQEGLDAFKGNAPTYHFDIIDEPKIVWDFNSLLLVVQLLYSLMLIDEDCPIKLCACCGKPFIAKNKNEKYCSEDCKNHIFVLL